jgi:preprotein translocase subunit SecD
MVAGLGLMFAVDAKEPRLGLDLAGGTSVTLLPRLESGGAISRGQLSQSIEIIRQRVNGLGVSEADVQTQGDNIVVSVPGATSSEAVNLISSTAQLRFRKVLQQEAVVPGAVIPQPSGSATPGASPDPGASPGASTAPTGEPGLAPTPTPSSAGRAVLPNTQTDPSATASAPADPSAAPTPTIPPLLTDPPAPGSEEPSAETLQAYATLDCSLPANTQGGKNLPADQPIATCDRDGTAKYLLSATVIEGTHISDASAGVNPTTNENLVQLSFDGTGTRLFGDITTELSQSGGQFAVVLDDVVVEAAGVRSGPILGGRAEISGGFTQKTASDLAQVLKYGALPVTFQQGEVVTVSASVGSDQLHKGILAGAIGLALVVVYSLAFYRGLGIVSIASLTVAGMLTWGLVSLMGDAIGFRLILAGVVGVIVSIGITADSFVVYFERVRDEIRDGKPIRVAVERAWPRARRTILVADAVTFLAALVLYFLSIGRVQNFAFTLGLTTLIDVAVVFWFTKPLVSLLVRRPFFRDGHPWSGLNPERAGAKPRRVGLKDRVAAAPGLAVGADRTGDDL